jgi:hypothetical protein
MGGIMSFVVAPTTTVQEEPGFQAPPNSRGWRRSDRRMRSEKSANPPQNQSTVSSIIRPFPSNIRYATPFLGPDCSARRINRAFGCALAILCVFLVIAPLNVYHLLLSSSGSHFNVFPFLRNPVPHCRRQQCIQGGTGEAV